jgi:hypothetical protein
MSDKSGDAVIRVTLEAGERPQVKRARVQNGD